MKNILVTTFFSFKEPLMQSYVLPYLPYLRKQLPEKSILYLVCLEKPELALSTEEKKAIIKDFQTKSIHPFFLRYHKNKFLFALYFPFQILYLCFNVIKYRVSIIHSWNLPGGIYGSIVSLLTFKPLIIDSCEPHADSMVENGTWAKQGMVYKCAAWLEKWQLKRAKALIPTVNGVITYIKKRYRINTPKIHIAKPACVDLTLFQSPSDKPIELKNKLGIKERETVMVYAGKFGGIYYDDEIFRFCKAAIDFYNGNFKALFLSNISKNYFKQQLTKHKIKEEHTSLHFLPHEKVPAYLSIADFALCPVKPLYSKQFCTPIKTGEYWASGLPVVIPPNISEDSNLIKTHQIGAIWEETTLEGCKTTLEQLEKIQKQAQLSKKIQEIGRTYRGYHLAEKAYQFVYSKLL